jgi:hypothetical protein
MKNSAQVSRNTTTPSSKLNLSAHDMRPSFPVCAAFQWIAPRGARLSLPSFRVASEASDPGIHNPGISVTIKTGVMDSGTPLRAVRNDDGAAFATTRCS